MIIIFEQSFVIKKPVAVTTNSTHLALVFKMLVKLRKVNVKMITSKDVVGSITVPRVFGTYSLVVRVFDNFFNLKSLYSSKNVPD